MAFITNVVVMVLLLSLRPRSADSLRDNHDEDQEMQGNSDEDKGIGHRAEEHRTSGSKQHLVIAKLATPVTPATSRLNCLRMYGEEEHNLPSRIKVKFTNFVEGAVPGYEELTYSGRDFVMLEGHEVYAEGDPSKQPGRSAVVYFFTLNEKDYVMKIPRLFGNDAIKDLLDESRIAQALNRMSIPAPFAWATHATFLEGNCLEGKTIPVIVKEMLYGFELDKVIQVVGRGDSKFTPKCLAYYNTEGVLTNESFDEMDYPPGHKNGAQQTLYERVKHTVTLSSRAISRKLHIAPNHREVLGKTVQEDLKDAWQKLAQDVSNPESSVGFVDDLDPANWMWARVSKDASYRLYLMDAKIYFNGTAEYTKLVNNLGNHGRSQLKRKDGGLSPQERERSRGRQLMGEIWKEYVKNWKVYIGNCEAQFWPKINMPEDVNQAAQDGW